MDIKGKHRVYLEGGVPKRNVWYRMVAYSGILIVKLLLDI